jgi:hypothetical protein
MARARTATLAPLLQDHQPTMVDVPRGATNYRDIHCRWSSRIDFDFYVKAAVRMTMGGAFTFHIWMPIPQHVDHSRWNGSNVFFF